MTYPLLLVEVMLKQQHLFDDLASGQVPIDPVKSAGTEYFIAEQHALNLSSAGERE